MGDHVPLPRRLSDLHLDDDTSDVAVKPSGSTRRQRDQSNVLTFEAPRSSHQERERSDRKAYANPNAERSPSPSSRYPSTMDFRDFERMEERKIDELRKREGHWTPSEEVRSLRRQLRERDEECLAQRAWIKELETEVKQLRKQLRTQGGPSDNKRPTYIKVHRRYLAAETLERFQLPWEYDPVGPRQPQLLVLTRHDQYCIGRSRSYYYQTIHR